MLPKESRPWKGEKRFNYRVPLVHSYYDDDNRLIRKRLGIFVDDPVTGPRKKAWDAYDRKTKVEETEITLEEMRAK